MAALRAAPSVSATLGVAAATVAVMAAILAGPSVIECSRAESGLGACLRDKLVQSGLVGPDRVIFGPHEIVADVPGDPAPPPAAPGWINVNANELSPLASVPLELTAVPDNIGTGDLPVEPAAPIEIAIAPPAGIAISAQEPVVDGGEVALGAETAGVLGAAAVPSEPASVGVALADLRGSLAAAAPDMPSVAGGAVALAPPDEPVEPVLVVAEPVPEQPVTVELTPAPSVEPPPSEPPAPPVFNPVYPNVIVLPPPALGDDSSFLSLRLN